MIASLTGSVVAVRLDSAVIDVSGVGYLVHATPATVSQWHLGEVVTASTSLVVREDSMTIYGFADEDERETFERLQTVSGVGPRLALAMLAVHTPSGLRAAVANEDLGALQRVPGIGKKGAQRLVLELAGKLGTAEGEAAPLVGSAAGNTPTAIADAVVDALVGLGWHAKVAADAVAVVSAAADGPAQSDMAELLRRSLQHLGGSRG